MKFRQLVLKNVFRRKVRSALTCAGVSIAVGAIIALLGLAGGIEASFAKLFSSGGGDLVVLEANAPDDFHSSMNESLGKRILENSDVVAVYPFLHELIAFPEEGVMTAFVVGAKPDRLAQSEIKIIEGRGIESGKDPSLIVGSVLARNLKKSVGDRLLIGDEPFEIIGIFESLSVFENGAAIMDLDLLQETLLREDDVTSFSVYVNQQGDKTATISRVQSYIESMTDSDGTSAGLAALPTRDYASSREFVKLSKGIAWAVSVVALAMGVLGVLNTMIMSVFERSSEIGVLRALGWTRWQIIRMIILESLVVSLGGAVAGSLLGIFTLVGLSHLPETSLFVSPDIPWASIAYGWVLAFLIGVGGAIYPAYFASRLLPSEALQHG